MRYNSTDMKLIIGLGNPSQQYHGTRHNLGFWYVSEFAAQHGLGWQEKSKFRAYLAEGSLGGDKFILAKPTTYYNLVGESAQVICQFYKIPPEDVLVVHDDLALPLGTIRTREGGSDGGNNGMKSIIAHLGQGVKRLRVGIDSPQRQHTSDAHYVLSKLSTTEIDLLSGLSPEVDRLIAQFIASSFTTTTVSAPRPPELDPESGDPESPRPGR